MSESSEYIYTAGLTIQVGTLNVGDMPQYLPERAVNTAEEIARMKFGVVGLQEVTAEHLAAIETQLPNHEKHFAHAYNHQKSGLMTLVDRDVFQHSESYRPNGRLSDSALLVTEITSHDGDEMVFITEHQPQEVYKEPERILRKIRAAKFIKKVYPNLPVVFATDTNSTKAAPLNILTPLLGYRSVHKEVHGREPYRTYPSMFGDELLNSRLDGKLLEVIASRGLRRLGNALRAANILNDDGHESPHAGCDVDRIQVNGHVEVFDAGLYANIGHKRKSDHLGVWGKIGLRQS